MNTIGANQYSEVRVQIVRFVDEHQPGVVACEFGDAAGQRHTLIDKVPIFTTRWLDQSSEYPQPGIARCEILDECSDDGSQLVRISTGHPDGVESTNGVTEFVIFASQLTCG